MAHILPRSSFHYPPIFNSFFFIFSHIIRYFRPAHSLPLKSSTLFLHFSSLMLQTGQAATSSLPSSSDKSSSSALHPQLKQGPESDEEIRRVPELGGESAVTSASRPDTSGGVVQGKGESRRKRGRSAADKETRRLKRLLRNRVSAQQARERKKAYLNDLETRVKDLEEKNTELEERLSTLQNENQMLRQILKNTTASRRGGSGGENE